MKKISILALLVLTISLFLIPSICFADVAGSYSLSSIYITMTEPKFNTVVPTDMAASSRNISVSNIVWKDSNGKIIANTDKLTSGGTYTVSFDLDRKGGDSFAARTQVYINNSTEGVSRSFSSTNKITASKSFTISGGRLSNAHGKADYFEDTPASTTTTDDGKKVVSNINIIVDGNVEEGKALPTTFQANSDIQKTFVTYNIYKETPSDTSKTYATWQQFDEKAQAGKSYTVRFTIPLPSTIELADDFRLTINGTPVSNPKTGLMGYLIQDYTYKVGETKPAASIVKYITKVEFEDYYFPVAGQEYNAQDVKLKSTVPGEITNAMYTMFNKELTGRAEKNDNAMLKITVKANSSYEFASDVKATIAGLEAQEEKISATEFLFVFPCIIEEGTSIKIVDQSPETIEYKDGDKIELFVKVSGDVASYQWAEQTTELISVGPKQVYKRTSIEGATSDKYVIEKATKEMNGYSYGCTVIGKDSSEISSKGITLKLVEEAVPSREEAKPSGEAKGEAKSSGETVTSGETKTEETKTEEKVEKVVWTEASNWALEELNKANDAGLIPSIFNKENLKKNITRKEFAHVAVKLYEKITGKKAEKIDKNPFTDTKDEEVLKAYKLEITNGISDTEFAPDKEITREQMATMMARALKAAGIDISVDLANVKAFADDDEMHDWSRNAIYFMAQEEVIKGVGDNKYGVLGTATREQSLLISVRSANKFSK